MMSSPSGPSSPLDSLVELSTRVGASLDQVQGNGGNTSVKSSDREHLWVKASGVTLAEVHRQGGWVQLPLGPLLKALESAEASGLPPARAQELSVQLTAPLLPPGAPRPSLEVSFHAFLGQVVLHTHPILANALGCLEDPEALLGKLADPVTLVPYRPPGLSLGATIRDLDGGSPEGLLLLQNHGLIVHGQAVGEVLERHFAFLERVESLLPPSSRLDLEESPPLPEERLWESRLEALFASQGESLRVRVSRFATSRARTFPPTPGLALTPDEVVYGLHRVVACGATPEAALEAWKERRFPRAVLLPQGLPPVLVGPGHATVATMDAYLLAQTLVRQLSESLGRLRPLDPEEIAFLANLESEKYRQSVLSRAGGTRTEDPSCKS